MFHSSVHLLKCIISTVLWYCGWSEGVGMGRDFCLYLWGQMAWKPPASAASMIRYPRRAPKRYESVASPRCRMHKYLMFKRQPEFEFRCCCAERFQTPPITVGLIIKIYMVPPITSHDWQRPSFYSPWSKHDHERSDVQISTIKGTCILLALNTQTSRLSM